MAIPIQTPTSSTIPLHRIRFYDQTPSPITCLAYPPTPLPAARDPSHKGKARAGTTIDEVGVLVVARENGDVEIHQWARENERSFGNWTCHKVLPPTLTHPSVSLMALVIRDPDNFHNKGYNVPKLEDLRLFTAGSDSTDLVERCLESGRILSTYPIPSPPLWSISVSPTHKYICLATSSPTLHFLSIPSTPTPLEPPPSHLLRSDTLPSRTRTVSLAWGIPKLAQDADSESGSGWSWRDTYLITGNSDSSFRKWEIPGPSLQDGSRQGQGRVVLKSRAVVEKMGKIKGKRVGGKGTIVWGVGVLPDHTIVTSDSLGSVTFWDGASMAQKQHFSAHKADGMCLLVGPNGKTIFTSGPDQRVCQFTYIPSTSNFALTSTKRLHSHDVRALAIFPSYSPITTSTSASDLSPILVSGGYDMSLTFTPAAPPSLLSEGLRNPLGKGGMSRCVFDEAFTRKMGYLTGGDGRVGVSRGGRLVLGRKERSVGLWRVLGDEQGWEKVLEMDLRLRTNLISSAISDDGSYIAISDLYETKLFHLSAIGNGTKAIRIKSFLQTLSTSKHTAHLDIASKGLGSSILTFTPDSRRLVLGHVQSGSIIVIALPSPSPSSTQGGEEVEVVKCFQMGGNTIHGRVIAGSGLTKKHRRRNGRNGVVPITVPVPVVDGDDAIEVDVDEKEEEEGEEEEVREEEEGTSKEEEGQNWISTLAASGDGQWLCSGDTAGRVTIFNLDTLQIHSTLPTLPLPASALLFPPSSPSLLLILTPQALTPYQIERRRLLPPNLNPQLSEINLALQGRYLPALSASFEPLPISLNSNGNGNGNGGVGVINKLVIWGNEYLLTARLDISDLNSRILTNKPHTLGSNGSKNTRRKRAREARDALERSTTGSSERSTPLLGLGHGNGHGNGRGNGHGNGIEGDGNGEMVKIHGGESFRSIIGAGWLGAGELVVVERPFADFVGELPPAFVSASYGRS